MTIPDRIIKQHTQLLPRVARPLPLEPPIHHVECNVDGLYKVAWSNFANLS